MKILHIIEDFSPNAYGLYSSLLNLLLMFKNTSIEMEVLYPPKTKNPWRYSPEFKSKLLENIKRFNIIHIHGIWLYPQYIAAKTSIKYDIPFILSPRGMLNKWTFDAKNNSILKILKKRIYMTFALDVFKKAAKIHALTPVEKENIMHFFPEEDKITIIPNSIDVDKVDKCFETNKQVSIPQKYILFIGRLDPIKGVDLLIRAFNNLNESIKHECKLIIAGPEWNKKYTTYLKNLAQNSKNIEFIGRVDGCQRFNLMHSAWIVAIPSFSEGFPTTALEAAACYTPIMTTYNVGLHDWPYEYGNLIVNNSIEDMKKAIERAISWNISERIHLGMQARKFTEQKFSTKTIREQWISLYSKLT